MKLVTAIFLIIFSAYANSNEQFIFPPKYQTPGTFVSENSMYLPPESHTPIPYFPVKKFGNLPFPYLPPTGTKSPVPFPSPFPMILSSSGLPMFDEDDDDNNDNNQRENKGPMSTLKPPFPYNRNNRTDNAQEDQIHKRDMRQIQKPMQYQQPIDRIDVRVPNKFPSGFSTPMPMNHNPTARSMIISAETHRNDNIFDQFKAGSSQGGLYVPPPGGFLSSTTEPAIPILRLSNEMDLDGSFSYEALGADQTHYVQHSHMENQGTEKEEQIVEGSYSYVGDNGQTYTVHYVADSNGFRASGDHLPVAPPIPEIIQRAVQYNLAEEAKKPPHLKSWQGEEQERDYNNEIHDKTSRFSIPPPPRSLFTGRTPEAFSYDFAQRSNNQNNLETAASQQSQSVVKTVDFTNNQQKTNINAGTIAPQVTFLASQGAHVPSINNPPQPVSRMFTNEKPLALPQLVNYEADDNNKALWRWQYGLNSNNHQINNNANQSPEKNSISRSSGDDVVINFNEMTPEQYTKMLQNQISPESQSQIQNTDNSQRHFTENINHHNNNYEKVNSNENTQYYQHNQFNNIMTPSTETVKSQNPNQYSDDWYKNYNNNANNPYLQQTYQQDNSANNYQGSSSVPEVKSTTSSPQVQHSVNSNINSNQYFQSYTKQDTSLRQKEKNEESFNPYSTVNSIDVNPNKFVTQANNYEDISYEPRRIKTLNHYTTVKPSFTSKNYVTNDEYSKINTPSYSTQNFIDFEKGSTLSVTQAPPTTTTAIDSIKFTDFISPDSNDSFKPIIKSTIEENHQELKEDIVNTDITNNIFLKNLLNVKKSQPEISINIKESSEKQTHKKVAPVETKSDKVAKYINVQSKPYNDITINKKKPIDISEIINYITMKNNFESSKLQNKPKKNMQHFDNHKLRNEMYSHIDEEGSDDEYENYSQKQSNHGVSSLYPQQGELRGNIKNYKVLQRNNNLSNGYDTNQLKRELVPPPVKLLQSQNLPPLGRAGPSTKSYLPPIYV